MTTTPNEELPKPIVPSVLYPHTIVPVPIDETVPKVDVDGLCDLFDRSSSAVLYINTTLSPGDAAALMEGHQLVAEYDAVRGVDGIRHATEDEIAAAQAAKTPST
jgi:hypothetical protein